MVAYHLSYVVVYGVLVFGTAVCAIEYYLLYRRIRYKENIK